MTAFASEAKIPQIVTLVAFGTTTNCAWVGRSPHLAVPDVTMQPVCWTRRRRLLNVTQSGDASQGPVVGTLRRTHQQERDIVEVSAVGLLVDWALVELGITRTCLDRVHVDDWKSREEDFVV